MHEDTAPVAVPEGLETRALTPDFDRLTLSDEEAAYLDFIANSFHRHRQMAASGTLPTTSPREVRGSNMPRSRPSGSQPSTNRATQSRQASTPTRASYGSPMEGEDDYMFVSPAYVKLEHEGGLLFRPFGEVHYSTPPPSERSPTQPSSKRFGKQRSNE